MSVLPSYDLSLSTHYLFPHSLRPTASRLVSENDERSEMEGNGMTAPLHSPLQRVAWERVMSLYPVLFLSYGRVRWVCGEVSFPSFNLTHPSIISLSYLLGLSPVYQN